ncbi:unnamed protein product [Arctogadus glacialis]
MELPLGGPSLRHYTQSRPRPHRQNPNHRPTRQQEPILESENEGLDHMGRVDEGVEEFFTKRVLPADSLKIDDEISPAIVPESLSASTASCPPPTRTLRRKLGDFFTLRKRRGLKTEPSQEGRSKKASIADLIRPLREAARADKSKKEQDRDHDKENDKERQKDKADGAGDKVVEEAPVALRSDAAPPRRALREGKSQSLILLSGSAAPGTGSTRQAKKSLDGQHSFEQKLSLMLQRIGVTKSQPAEEQSPEGEMKKADSEGTIIDNKPEPPPTASKPRTMSTSSDTRHQIRQSASAHEAAGKPALPPKPTLRTAAPLAPPSGRSTPENELAHIKEADARPPDPPVSTAVSAPVDPTAPTAPAAAIAPSDTLELPRPLSSSADPSGSTEPSSLAPMPSAAAPGSSTPPPPPTTVAMPIRSSGTLSPLPSTPFESITLTPLSHSSTTTSTTSTAMPSGPSSSVSISSSSAVPLNSSPSSPSPGPVAAVPNMAGSALVSQDPSSDATTVDTVSAGTFQNAAGPPSTHSPRTMTHPHPVSTTDISPSSETPAPSIATPVQGLADTSSICKTPVEADPPPSAGSTASSCVEATPPTANVTSLVSTDSAHSIVASPNIQPGPPLPSDTNQTSCPEFSTSGAPNTSIPPSTSGAPDTSTPPSTSTSQSEQPASVNLRVTNRPGATGLSSINTEYTEVPSVTMTTAASRPDSTSPTNHRRAEVNNVQTPPEEKPRHDSPTKEKVTDDDVDRNVQRSKQEERNGDSQEESSTKHPEVERGEAQQVRAEEREDHLVPDNSTVATDPETA